MGWLTTEFNRSLTLAYDYAISGAAVDKVNYQGGEVIRGYKDQVTEDFVPYAGSQMDKVWKADNSIFSKIWFVILWLTCSFLDRNQQSCIKSRPSLFDYTDI